MFSTLKIVTSSLLLYVMASLPLPYSTVRDSIKDIKEAAKDDDTTKLYRTLGAQAREANEFLKAYKAIMPS